MIGNWEIAELSEPRRYVLYAEAYLHASIESCRRMRDDESERTWPNAVVVMMLAVHSLELFLKGTILKREPTANLGKHHRIDCLANKYSTIYTEPEFRFEVPFQGEYPGFSDTEIEALKKNEPVPSILFRYPVDKPGVEWQGIHAFEPQGFIELLAYLKESYNRIGKSL